MALPKLILETKDFLNTPFNSLMASGNGRRLWATVTIENEWRNRPGVESDNPYAKVVFKVENMKKNSHIEIETESIEDAITKFNEI